MPFILSLGELYRLEKKFSFVTVEVYGKTHEGRELLALHINKSNRNTVFLTSLIHAREWISGCVTMKIINQLLNSSEGEKLINLYRFIIIPVSNPDGYEYSHTNNRYWRKNREPTANKHCFGVDINRNFAYGFKVVDNVSEISCSELYQGSEPLSSKEAQMLNFILIKYHKDIRYFVDYHSYGNVWMYAYGTHQWTPRNSKQLIKFSDEAVKVLKNYTQQMWKSGSAFHVLYACHGILVDHVHYYVTPLAFTAEVGNEESGFLIPDNHITHYTSSQWEVLRSQLQLLQKHIHSGEYTREKHTNWRKLG